MIAPHPDERLDHTDFIACPSPGWRWHRACQLFQAGKRAGRREDRAVTAALAYLRVREAGRKLSPTAQAIDQAITLHDGADARRRWLLEAYLLTSADVQEIALRTSEEEVVVAWYRDLVYAVRYYPEAHGWRTKIILDGRKRHKIQPDDQEFFLKLFANCGGVEVLEEVRAYFESPAPPHDSPEHLPWLRVRAAILARCLPASAESAALLFELQRLGETRLALAENQVSLLAPLRPAMTLDDLVKQFADGHPMCPAAS
jgi:hypothetical protein